MPVVLREKVKNKDTGGKFILTPTATVNTTHSLTFGQTNIKLHTKDLFISVPITQASDIFSEIMYFWF